LLLALAPPVSGPPINRKKYWKGWERTKDDLDAEQQAIEAVARSLCWTKVKEADDIAVWQKPYNHVKCMASRRAAAKLAPQFCSSKNPDAAWYSTLTNCTFVVPNIQSHLCDSA
jgi:hypothetical protein